MSTQVDMSKKEKGRLSGEIVVASKSKEHGVFCVVIMFPVVNLLNSILLLLLNAPPNWLVLSSFWVLLVVVATLFCIWYLKRPTKLVAFSAEKKVLFLPKGVEVPLSDVFGVCYERSSLKLRRFEQGPRIWLPWGTMTIYFKKQKQKIFFVRCDVDTLVYINELAEELRGPFWRRKTK